MSSFLFEIRLKIFIDTGIRHPIFANNTQTLHVKVQLFHFITTTSIFVVFYYNIYASYGTT